ncbi:Fe-S cluster assembly scaffold SufA [Candidatus Steffania adelgidicola]|uniref:Fe-S cluster assembly scaffold SufA n=1 Tax=Candidatus Steffania adelgidicola TaxID=1076626 RepID=UPI001D02DED2|nr:Fe-S cluster assembly scaffold SufA [Candidatus Steffania adelgidicola]UDG80031.1 Protein SufA [Candidatus Steffania adelgidicola]
MQVENAVKICSPEENIWHGLTLTESAARQILRLVKSDPNMLGLRLSVKPSGCAGFCYIIEKVIQVELSERVYGHGNARIYIPLKAMPFIDGTEVDYVQEGLNQMFKFNNPQAQHACGCGESFSL